MKIIKQIQIDPQIHFRKESNHTGVIFGLVETPYYPNYIRYMYRKYDFCISAGDFFEKRNDILFFDFYALHPIWCFLKKRKDRHFDYVNKLFEIKCFTLGNIVLKSLQYSINSESKYVFGMYNQKNSGTCKKIRYQFAKQRKLKININPKDVDLKIKKSAFLFREMWECEYGGYAWAEACDYCLALENALKNYDMNKIILLLDSIFDLQHNTGHILNKDGSFDFLGNSICVLNFRSVASLKELAFFSSIKVKNIVNKYGKELELV